MESKRRIFPTCGETVGLFILSVAVYCLAIALDKTPTSREDLVAMGLPPGHVLSFSEKAIGMQMILVEVIFVGQFIAAIVLRSVITFVKEIKTKLEG